ncbi:MAG TPA: hypothetical protein VMS74_02595 [Acidimicrobiia bacterium]|nr:hypothetical protein [Acidimicrobiia bacterium]
MIPRLLSILLALSVLAACSPTDDDSGRVDDSITTSTDAPVEPLEPVELMYRYLPGETLTYDLSVNQDIAFNADGDADGFGDASLPIDADLVTESEGQTTYTVAESAPADATTLGIVARFPTTRVAGTVNGETVDNLEEGGVEADLARIDAVDVSVTVNSAGRVTDDGSEAAGVLGASLAALTGLTNDLFATPVGPVLARDRAVTVGDEWETMSTLAGQSGPVDVTSASQVVDVIDGLFIIETTTVTDAYTVDFSREFRELSRVFAEEEEGGELTPEVLDEIDSIEFVITVEEATTVEVAEFDPDRGVVRSATVTTGMRLAMVFRSPNENGQIVGFDISLDIAQTAIFDLVD